MPDERMTAGDLQSVFEEWIASSNYPEIADVALAKLPDGNYRSQLTFAAWQGWQGAYRNMTEEEEPKVLSFNDAHDKRHGPDAEFVCRDAKGVKWFKFTCQYSDEDGSYGFQIWAKDHDDAVRRLNLIRESGAVSGQIFSEVPA